MDRAACHEADVADALAPLRARFCLPEEVIYLDGNSLGPLQPAVAARLVEVVDHQWGQGLIRSWNDAGWIELHTRIAAQIAPLVGAYPDEIAVADSTSVNLFKVLSAALKLRPDRRVILTDEANFPTDIYMADGLADLLEDVEVRVVAAEAVAAALDEDVAALLLTHVDYRTGAITDPVALTQAAHAAGALAVWDLSHSTGALEVDLHRWNADLAVGCSYKFLNGGPGAPAYLYVARRWAEQAMTPLRGWFGHEQPFAFDRAYRPAAGVARFLGGTPPILSLAALEAALEIRDGLDPALVAAKARDLTELFITLVDARCGADIEVVSPRDAWKRGAQVSLRHPQAAAVMQALIARGVIGDHRPPDLLRFGFAPLYLSYTDVWNAVDRLAGVLASGEWDQPQFKTKRAVT